MILLVFLGSSTFVGAVSSVVVEATAVSSADETAGDASSFFDTLFFPPNDSGICGGIHGSVTHFGEEVPSSGSKEIEAAMPPKKIALGNTALTASIMFSDVLEPPYFEIRCPDVGTVIA